MKATSISHAASYAEFACQTFTMKHAKQYLRDCGICLDRFKKALACRRKVDFLDELYTIQADERWSKK